MTEDQLIEIKAELAANDTEHQSFKRRLDEHDNALKKQTDMLIIMERQSNALEGMDKSLGRVEKKVDSIDCRVAQIEQEPGNNWKKVSFEIVKYLVIAILGAGVGYIINLIVK